jgi:hypothetical protein
LCVRNFLEIVCIIIVIVIAVVVVVVVVVVVICSHNLFLLGISTFVPKVIPTALSSSFRLHYVPFDVRYSKYSCRFCFFLRYWYLLNAVCHAAFCMCSAR